MKIYFFDQAPKKTFLIAYSAYTKTKFLQKKLRNQHQDDKTYNFLFPYRDWGV